jgi:hypothetical protein
VNAALRGVFYLGDFPEGGDEKLKTEKLRIWQSIGAPEGEPGNRTPLEHQGVWGAA